MRAWSFAVGKLFGVEVRVHALLPLLLSACVLWASVVGRPGSRGVILWLLLVGAVLVREAARALAMAWYGQEVRTVLLLPTGGLLEGRPSPEAGDATERRVLALAGPVASFAVALLIAGVSMAMAPEVDLAGQRWITPEHLLRSAVWINLLMGAVNLLPAWPLDGGRQAEAGSSAGARTGILQQGPGARAGRRLVGLLIAVAFVVFGS